MKCPTSASRSRVTSAKNASRRSDHATGNSGSCSGQSTVVGTAIRASGAGSVSATARTTVAAPARYQAIDAVNAPGGA